MAVAAIKGEKTLIALAQDFDDRQAERQPPGDRAGDQPGQCLLKAPPGVGRLAAISDVRTFLSYFRQRDTKEISDRAFGFRDQEVRT